MEATAFTAKVDGKEVVLRPTGFLSDRFEALVDGIRIGEERKPKSRWLEFESEGIRIRARVNRWELFIQWAEVETTDGRTVPLDPEPGTRKARLEEWGARHPKLYSARHAVAGAAQILVPIIGIGFLIGLLPSIPLPSIPFPDVPSPNVSLPSIPFPDIRIGEPPGWVQSVLDVIKLLIPVFIGAGIGVAEYRRRRRQNEQRRANREGEGSPEDQRKV